MIHNFIYMSSQVSQCYYTTHFVLQPSIKGLSILIINELAKELGPQKVNKKIKGIIENDHDSPPPPPPLTFAVIYTVYWSNVDAT